MHTHPFQHSTPMTRTSQRFILPALLTILLGVGACSSEAWEELPSAIAAFITQYFPGSGVDSYHETDSGCTVKVNNGATLQFDSDNQWTEINGNGVPLPAVMMYDQLPEKLYSFLEATARQDGVYSMNRDRKTYVLHMLDTTITYNIQTGDITFPPEVKPD